MNSSRDVVPDSQSQHCNGMSVKVQEGVRTMQDGRSATAQCPRRLMTVQLTHQKAQDTSVHSPERDGAKFEIYGLADQQPMTPCSRVSFLKILDVLKFTLIFLAPGNPRNVETMSYGTSVCILLRAAKNINR